MVLRRRTLILGAGTVLVGGGVVATTGAFSGTQNRNVTVDFADDSGAYLGMSPIDGDDRENVSVTSSDGVIGISVENINADAQTILGDLIQFTNNSPRRIEEMSVEITDLSQGADLSVRNIPEEIGAGESVTALGLKIDTRGYSVEPAPKGSISIRTVLAQETSS